MSKKVDKADDLEKTAPEINDEEEVVYAKQSGFKRTSPSASSEPILKEDKTFKCTWKDCDKQLESDGLLRSHLNEHKEEIECDICDITLKNSDDLKDHITKHHNDKDWNCNDCFFQANNSEVLMNHLKLTGHKPSPNIEDSRNNKVQCYTCNEEFLNFWSLMNHRKANHPSNRVCRYFLKGKCIHGSK